MKKVLWICNIIILLNSCTGAGKWLTSAEGYRFYIEMEEKATWFQAIDECKQRSMALISMDSQEKNQVVYHLIRTNFDSIFKSLWIGGHDHNVSRYFEWIATGESFGYTNWQSSQPNNANDHCVDIWTEYGKWYDDPCNYTYGFVCEDISQLNVRNELVLLKESMDNQTNLLKDKTEELDSLQQEFEKFKRESLEEMKQRQDEFVTFRKSSEQKLGLLNQTQKELKAQISSDAEAKEILNNLLKYKTEELDSFKKEFEKFRTQVEEIQTNLKQEYKERNKIQEIKEEFVKLQKSSEQTELSALKEQMSNENEIKQMLRDIQTTQVQNQNQIIDKFTKSRDFKNSEVIKPSGNQDISNPIFCATQTALLKVKSEELDDLKKANKELFVALQKSYETNTNHTIPNKNYNVHIIKN